MNSLHGKWRPKLENKCRFLWITIYSDGQVNKYEGSHDGNPSSVFAAVRTSWGAVRRRQGREIKKVGKKIILKFFEFRSFFISREIFDIYRRPETPSSRRFYRLLLRHGQGQRPRITIFYNSVRTNFIFPVLLCLSDACKNAPYLQQTFPLGTGVKIGKLGKGSEILLLFIWKMKG